MKNLIQRRGVRQLIKFGLVGATGMVVDLGIYNLLAVLFGYNIYVARLISFTLAATNNYIFNRKWTFRSQNKKIALEFGQFFFIATIGLLINLGVMRLLQPFALRFTNELVQKNVPVIFAIIIVFAWNFTANKLWVFKKITNYQ